MADLAASDVTVTLLAPDRYFLPVPLTMSFPTITFGDGEKTYPAGGIPLPAVAKFGVKAIKRFHIQSPGNGYVYSYDPANHKLIIEKGAAGPLVPFTGAPAETTLRLTIIGE